MVELALHDFGDLNLEHFGAASGWGLVAIVATTKAMTMQPSLCDVCDVVLNSEIENPFGVSNDCCSI